MAMIEDEKIKLLAGLELFEGIPEASLRAVAQRAAEADFEPGRYLVQQAQLGSGLFVIIEGTVRVVRGSEVLAELGPGEMIGEIAVLDQAPRMASAIAETPVRCLGIASWDFLHLLETDPHLARNVLRVMAQRLRTTTAAHRH